MPAVTVIRTVIGGVAALAIVSVAAYGLFMYYMFGGLTVPHLSGWEVPLPDGATIAVHGVGETSFHSSGAQFEATYQHTADAPVESIGDWHGDTWTPTAYVAGGSELRRSPHHQQLSRKQTGQWRQRRSKSPVEVQIKYNCLDLKLTLQNDGDRVQRQYQLQGIVEEPQCTETLMPSRSALVLRVDRKSDSADFLSDRQSPFAGGK
jgi:hypothetical protein